MYSNASGRTESGAEVEGRLRPQRHFLATRGACRDPRYLQLHGSFPLSASNSCTTPPCIIISHSPASRQCFLVLLPTSAARIAPANNLSMANSRVSSNNRNMTTMGPTGLELGLGGSGSALQSLRGQWYQRAVFEWSLVPELNVKILELV